MVAAEHWVDAHTRLQRCDISSLFKQVISNDEKLIRRKFLKGVSSGPKICWSIQAVKVILKMWILTVILIVILTVVQKMIHILNLSKSTNCFLSQKLHFQFSKSVRKCK